MYGNNNKKVSEDTVITSFKKINQTGKKKT